MLTTEASFRPQILYGIRLGIGARDYVESHPPMPAFGYGERVIRRNQRFIAIIPQREFDWQDIPGRFTYELTGFVESTLSVRDLHPASSTTDEFRGLGLRSQYFLGGPPGNPGTTIEFDGKVQVLRYESMSLGCSSPDTFTYRTRVPPTTPPDVSIGIAYDKGEIEVNGSTRLKFTGLPSPDGNPFSAKSQLDITSPGLAPARYTVDTFFAEEVRAAAVCH